MNQAIIGLGSNIDPQENIQKAKEIMDQEFNVLGESDFVATKPVGCPPQPDFINGAILLETQLSLEQLKDKLNNIEIILGRAKQSNKFEPRAIDLDIIVYNGKVLDKDFYEREFLKISVLQLLPGLKY